MFSEVEQLERRVLTMTMARDRSTLRRFAALFTGMVIIGSAACSGDQQPGSMVIGSRAASEFKMSAGTELPEIRRDDTPLGVLDSSSAWAKTHGYDTRCSRVFVGSELYVVLFSVACGRTLVFDGEALGAFDRDGVMVSLIPEVTVEDVSNLSPEVR